MGKKTPYLKFGVVGFIFVFAALFAFNFFAGDGITWPQFQVFDTEADCIGAGGTWSNGVCTIEALPIGYVPFTLSNVYMKVMNALDKDASYGVGDVRVKIYNKGEFDFVGPYRELDGSNGEGTIDLDNKTMRTGIEYTALVYQGDGGTNVYTDLFDFKISLLGDEKTYWYLPETIYVYTEGAWTESALDSSNNTLDEEGDNITINKSSFSITGCQEWDFVFSNSEAGSILKNPVIVFEEDASNALTDRNDIENIYLTVKSGSGFSFPDGDLVQHFLGGVPIPVTSDGMLGSADGGVGTLKICFPASESNLGTGGFLMHFDDMGDYRARDHDNDVRAAVETMTWTIVAGT